MTMNSTAREWSNWERMGRTGLSGVGMLDDEMLYNPPLPRPMYRGLGMLDDEMLYNPPQPRPMYRELAPHPRAMYRLSGLAQAEPLLPSDIPAGSSVSPSGTSITSDFATSLTDVAKAYASYSSTQKLLDLNIQRAAQGLPPLDSSQVGMGINVGVSPAVQQMLIWGGGAALAIWLFTTIRKR